jgi:nudix-type nucleoside diphosphatase (YffH/AdpP family)
MTPEILRREIIYAGYLRLERLTLRLDGGAVVVREVEDHGQSIAVLPYDAARRTALIVRLFRVPPFDRAGEPHLEEACAGMIDEEDPQDATRREALEELGVRLDELDFVGRVWPSPGVSAERTSLFLARYSTTDRIAAGGGLASEHENITVIERPLDELAASADAGLIDDHKLLTLVLALRLRHRELFAAPA